MGWILCIQVKYISTVSYNVEYGDYTDQLWVAILYHLPQYVYGSRVAGSMGLYENT